MISIAAVLVSVMLSKASILSSWTIELMKKSTSLERYQTAQYSSLLAFQDHFLVGREDGWIEFRSVKNGSILWNTQLLGAVQSQWTESGGILFGGDAKGNLYALSSSTGETMWRSSTKGVFFSKPLLAKGLLWVINSHGTLQCYEANTGRWRWQAPDPKLSMTNVLNHQGPVFFQGLVVAGFPSGLIRAFDPDDGQVRWSESFSSDFSSVDGLNSISSLLADSEYLIASSFSGNLRVWKSLGASKKFLWEKKISLHVSPGRLGGDLLVSGRDGSVRALDINSGYEKWNFTPTKGLALTPSVINDKIWITTTNGEVYVLDATGALLSRRTSIESSFWSAALPISDGHALVMSSQGLVRNLFVSGT